MSGHVAVEHLDGSQSDFPSLSGKTQPMGWWMSFDETAVGHYGDDSNLHDVIAAAQSSIIDARKSITPLAESLQREHQHHCSIFPAASLAETAVDSSNSDASLGHVVSTEHKVGIEHRTGALLAIGKLRSRRPVPKTKKELRAHFALAFAGMSMQKSSGQEDDVDAVLDSHAHHPDGESEDWARLHSVATLAMVAEPGDKAVAEKIHARLRDPFWGVRELAVEVLAEVAPGDPHTAVALGKCLQDVDSRVRWAAIRALERSAARAKLELESHEEHLKTSGPETLVVLDYLLDQDGDTRKAAVQALSSVATRGDEKAVDALRQRLEDPEWDVRLAAAHGLSKISEPGDRETLLALNQCATTEWQSRTVKASALRSMCLCSTGGVKLVAELEQKIGKKQRWALEELLLRRTDVPPWIPPVDEVVTEEKEDNADDTEEGITKEGITEEGITEEGIPLLDPPPHQLEKPFEDNTDEPPKTPEKPQAVEEPEGPRDPCASFASEPASGWPDYRQMPSALFPPKSPGSQDSSALSPKSASSKMTPQESSSKGFGDSRSPSQQSSKAKRRESQESAKPRSSLAEDPGSPKNARSSVSDKSQSRPGSRASRMSEVSSAGSPHGRRASQNSNLPIDEEEVLDEEPQDDRPEHEILTEALTLIGNQGEKCNENAVFALAFCMSDPRTTVRQAANAQLLRVRLTPKVKPRKSRATLAKIEKEKIQQLQLQQISAEDTTSGEAQETAQIQKRHSYHQTDFCEAMTATDAPAFEYADWSWRARLHSILALGEGVSQDGISLAQASLEDGHPDIRLTAVAVLARAAASDNLEAIDILTNAGCHLSFERHWDWQVRCRALRALGDVASLPDTGVRAVVAGLEEYDVAVRTAAGLALGRLSQHGSPCTVRAILAELHERQDDVCEGEGAATAEFNLNLARSAALRSLYNVAPPPDQPNLGREIEDVLVGANAPQEVLHLTYPICPMWSQSPPSWNLDRLLTEHPDIEF